MHAFFFFSFIIFVHFVHACPNFERLKIILAFIMLNLNSTNCHIKDLSTEKYKWKSNSTKDKKVMEGRESNVVQLCLSLSTCCCRFCSFAFLSFPFAISVDRVRPQNIRSLPCQLTPLNWKNKAMHTLHFISLLLCFMLSKWGVSCASFSCVLLELIKHACLFLSFACTHARCQQA